MTAIPVHERDREAPVCVGEDRWQPARAGLVNVWQYTNEILEFERGRLVLFGPNGSGKTMALELLLPFLLDAKGQPGRLSTSGRDRGGLWERVTGYDDGQPRTGYVWIEFARNEETFTAGVRLRAKPAGGGTKHWFTTPGRVGMDLELLDDASRPLSVEQLQDAVGPQGRLWGSDTSGYRQAVRRTLFPGWSEERLEALVSTLLVVRKQNVTDGLSPARLSELLSEALPPLDDMELGRVADGFADLDRRRDQISQLEAEVAATRRLAQANGRYALAVSARVVGDVVSATTAFDNVAREVRRLQEQLTRYEALVRELELRHANLVTKSRGLDGRLDGLKSSEAYRHGAELQNLKMAAEGALQREKEARRAAIDARDRADDRENIARRDRDEQQRTGQQMHRARKDLESSASLLGAEMLRDLGDDALVAAANTWIEGRERAISEVRALLRELDRAITRREAEQGHKTDCEENLTVAEDHLQEATRASDEALRRWAESVDAWRAGASELASFLEDLEEPGTAEERVSTALDLAKGPLIGQTSRIEQSLAAIEDELGALRQERDAWRAGREPQPEVPEGRRDRTGLAGAPLWRIVQFKDGVDETDRGFIESALAHSRLLDAWVSPDGRAMIESGKSDIQLLLEPTTRQAGQQTLRGLLEPDPASDALSRDSVETLLSSIAVVQRDAHSGPARGGVTIGMDGSWRTPRLAGRAPMKPSEYIGVSSRERSRLARIESLEREISRKAMELDALNAELQMLRGRIQRCDHERRTFPPIREIQEAQRQEDRMRARMETARDQLQKAIKALEEATGAVQHGQRALHTVATRHTLPTDHEGLAGYEEKLKSVRNHVLTFQGRHERSIHAAQLAVRSGELAQEAGQEADRCERRARRRHDEYSEAQGRYQAVDRAIGADYREVIAEISRISSRQAQIKDEQDRLGNQKMDAAENRGAAASELAQAERLRADADAHRARTGETFVALCRDGLLSDAGVAEPPAHGSLTTNTAILEAARRIRASERLPAPPADHQLQTLSNRVMERMGETSRQLSGRADLTFEADEHFWSVLRTRHEGVVTSAKQLLDGLREDLDAARSELSRKQQELFEQILSGSVRDHLKGRLWAAQELVDRINDLLAGIRTESGGVKVGLRWEIDPDQSEATELRQAKELLLHDSPIASGRSRLDDFLRKRIERVRASEEDTGEWRDRLARMLDYRAWHRFRVLVHHVRFGEKPRPLDSRRVSLSTGEKTMVMVLPLIAAVAAHYEPAPEDPPCQSPRLLLMDELFPKLDFPNKRSLMGLLPTLHLDAVFTSDKDRCEYDSLDGIAIHVCQKLQNDKTTTTRLVWNGSVTSIAPDSSAREAPPRPSTLRSVEE